MIVKEQSIIEEVRALKEANAAEHDFDIARIIAAARVRQETTGRVILRLPAPAKGKVRRPQ